MEVVSFLSQTAGIPEDQIRALLCLAVGYPLAFGHKFLPNPTTKHVYGIFFGLLFSVFVLGPFAWLHAFVSSTVVYLMVAYLPKSYAHKAAFVFVMGYMSASHIYRQYTDYLGWRIDFTAPQMILTIKLTSFAFNMSDGHWLKEGKKLIPEWESNALFRLPSLLEFYGFVFFFAGYIGGPSFEMRDYLAFTDLSKFRWVLLVASSALVHSFPPDLGKRRPGDDDKKTPTIPSTLLPAGKVVLKAMCCLPLYMLAFQFPSAYLTTEQYHASSLLYKHVYLYITWLSYRMKFYFGWYLSEGMFVMSGMGLTGYNEDGTIRGWNGVTNIHFWEVELAQNVRALTENWNAQSGKWLRNYCYMRLTPPSGVPRSWQVYATMLLSAFWHGFYPSYYTAFASAALVIYIARVVRRKLRPLFLRPGWVKLCYDVMGIVATWIFFSYAGGPFMLLELRLGLQLWASLYWDLHMVGIATLFFLKFIM